MALMEERQTRMRWFDHWSIATKLLTGLGVLIAITAILGWFSIDRLNDVNSASQEVRENWLPSTRALGDLSNFMSDYRTAEANVLLAATAEERAIALAELGVLATRTEAIRRLFEALPMTQGEERFYAAFRQNWDAYRAVSTRLVDLVSTGDQPAALALYRTEAKYHFDSATDALTRLTDINVAGGKAASDQVRDSHETSLRLVLLALAANGLIGAIILGLIHRRISLPIIRLADAVTDLVRRGDTDPPGHTDRQDEIGTMARAIEIFRRNALDLRASRSQLEAQAAALTLALERERAMLQAQRDFIAMASHEFRTPLTAIDGHARRLEKSLAETVEADAARRLARIRIACQRLNEVIGGLVEASRSDATLSDPVQQPVALLPLIEDIIARETEADPGRKIDLTAPTAQTLTVIGDPALLDHAIANVLRNALTYAPADKPVQIHVDRQEGGAMLEIRDFGPGVPPSDLPTIFDRYRRGSAVGNIPGTGMGLHLARTIVELHGGSISAETLGSGRIQGFCVRLFLPLTVGPNSQERLV